MGEDTGNSNPPINIHVAGSAGLGVGGHASIPETIGEPRFITLGICVPGTMPSKQLDAAYNRIAPLKKLADINRTFVHELVHAVDVLDQALCQKHQDYYANLRRQRIGKLQIGPFITNGVYLNSPLESRARAVVAELESKKQIPPIIRRGK